MVTKLLSFQFYFKYGKNILIISSIVTSIAIFIFMIFYLLFGTKSKIEVFSFLMFYISTSNIFNYYLIKSKPIKYDSKSIFIQNGPNYWVEIPIKSIIKIKRTFHYFYTVYFRNNDASEKKVIFFISPNPSFVKSKKVKEILSYAKK